MRDRVGRRRHAPKARNAARFADDRAGGRAVGQKETPDRLHEAVSGCGSVAGCWDVRAEKQNRCTESMGPSSGRPVEGEKVSGGATRRTAVVDRSKADRDSLGSGAVCVDKQNLEVNFLFVVFEINYFFFVSVECMYRERGCCRRYATSCWCRLERAVGCEAMGRRWKTAAG